MKFEQKLIPGTLIKRYKRFLADIKLDSGEIVTAHCPNSGSMKTCQEPGWKVLLSASDNPKRKLKYTWEMVHNGTCWIGINTHLANKLAVEAIKNGIIKELQGYDDLRTEVKYGKNSRVDILLSSGEKKCYVEVKNVTLVDEGIYKFPDSVTTRGQKHLRELSDMIKLGHRAVMLYAVQRTDGTIFQPAEKIDPVYTETLKKVHNEGLEILPYTASLSPQEIFLENRIPFSLA